MSSLINFYFYVLMFTLASDIVYLHYIPAYLLFDSFLGIILYDKRNKQAADWAQKDFDIDWNTQTLLSSRTTNEEFDIPEKFPPGMINYEMSMLTQRSL